MTRTTFRVYFALTPLEDVHTWGDNRLHWFGLTDGRYDVEIGPHRLFSIDGDPLRGVDYYVVRLWEDLLELVPDVLDPLPEPLAARVATGDAWEDWIARVGDAEIDHDLAATGLVWWWRRDLDAGHLRGAPTLRLWRRGDDVHASWRTRPSDEPDLPRWCSPAGDAVIDADQLRDELVRFDKALMDEMRARAASWRRTDVNLDLDDLRRDHADRATWLASRLHIRRGALPTWPEVLEAIAELERLVPPVRK